MEDGQSETYIPVTVVVSLHMTIAQLKDKVPVVPVLFFDHTHNLTVLFSFKSIY